MFTVFDSLMQHHVLQLDFRLALLRISLILPNRIPCYTIPILGSGSQCYNIYIWKQCLNINRLSGHVMSSSEYHCWLNLSDSFWEYWYSLDDIIVRAPRWEMRVPYGNHIVCPFVCLSVCLSTLSLCCDNSNIFLPRTFKLCIWVLFIK